MKFLLKVYNVIVSKAIAIFMVLAFLLSSECFAQPSSKVIRERKKMVKKTFGNSPVHIILNGKRKMSLEEFLNFSEETESVFACNTTEENTPSIGVYTKAFMVEERMRQRKNAIRIYRENEMSCFFGDKSPLIYFGEKIITKIEYYNLDEDTVAFVNFYPTDFVRQYYSAKGGENGVVYVCPRERRLELPYSSHHLPIPVGGRNYYYTTQYGSPTFNLNNRSENEHSYIKRALVKYKDAIMPKTKAVIVLGCVVSTTGKIQPILIEDVRKTNDLGVEQMGKLIEISKEIILSMPEWVPPVANVYDNEDRLNIAYYTETYVQIPIVIDF